MDCYCFAVTIMLMLLLMIFRLHCLQEKKPTSQPVTETHQENPDFPGCGNKEEKVRLFLTISSLASVSEDNVIQERKIEINWYGGAPRDGDTVSLYDRDPANLKYKALDTAFVSDHPGRFYVTSVQLPHVFFTETNLTSKCLGYWAAYLEGGSKLRATACFKARPTWMADHNMTLANVTLIDLVVPGSHDAGSYEIYQGKKSENIVTRYMYTQEESIFQQLVYGIRHLDLRIGYYPKSKDVFWINHSVFKTENTLARVLRDVRRFVDATTHEVVILDLHNFPIGFDDDSNNTAHKRLVGFLLQELDDYMVPTRLGFRATLSKIWALPDSKRRRVIVAYSSRHKRSSPTFLWKGVRQVWANKQELEDLAGYFQNFFDDVPPVNTLWSAMAELTPSTSFIFSHPEVGLRVLANVTNRNVTSWFRDKWWRKATIVATDYILGNGMVEVAIANNIKKVRCSNRS